MIQIFFKSRLIKQDEWDKVYAKIELIVARFPLKLTRIESYDGFTQQIDKEYLDVHDNVGQEDECISFWGDDVSFSASQTVKFYKNWEIQRKHLKGKEIDEQKPLTWINETSYKNDGNLPDANGESIKDWYVETGSACYRYALMAIGTMLENELPGRVFMIAYEYDPQEGNEVARWLSASLGDPFDVAMYFDKQRLLDSFIDHYEDKKNTVGRMEKLYYKQVKQNIEFAISNIGHEPALQFYASALAKTGFMTWGFSDILDPWIACNHNLDQVLNIIDLSRDILLSDPENDRNMKNAEEYDYRSILEKLLDQYILWTPEQRSILNMFYTNKEALETGNEDLWGVLYRMSGLRIDICPMYASREQLFESFMYHDPKHGKDYLDIIDKWVNNPKNSYDEARKRIEETQSEMAKQMEGKNQKEKESEIKALELSANVEKYIEQFPPHDRPFWREALTQNPAYMNKEKAIRNLLTKVTELQSKKKTEDTNMPYFLKKKPEELRLMLLRRIKNEDKVIVRYPFEQWIEEETSIEVLASLLNFLYISIYNGELAFARTLFFQDNKYWDLLRTGTKSED